MNEAFSSAPAIGGPALRFPARRRFVCQFRPIDSLATVPSSVIGWWTSSPLGALGRVIETASWNVSAIISVGLHRGRRHRRRSRSSSSSSVVGDSSSPR